MLMRHAMYPYSARSRIGNCIISVTPRIHEKITPHQSTVYHPSRQKITPFSSLSSHCHDTVHPSITYSIVLWAKHLRSFAIRIHPVHALVTIYFPSTQCFRVFFGRLIPLAGVHLLSFLVGQSSDLGITDISYIPIILPRLHAPSYLISLQLYVIDLHSLLRMPSITLLRGPRIYDSSD